MKKIILYPLALAFSLVLFSCASSPRFRGNGDFCGMIVDENNEPVNEYLVSCYKGGVVLGSALTNQSGIFAIQNIPAGKYTIEGQKEFYSDIKDLKVDFCFRDKFFCCTAFTTDGVFENVKRLIKLEDYDGALEQLRLLRCQRSSYVWKVRLCYESYVYALKKDTKAAANLLRRVRKLNESEFYSFASEVEEVLNEKTIQTD